MSEKSEPEAQLSVLATRIDLSGSKPDLTGLMEVELCNIVLKDGKRVRKTARVLEIRNRHDGTFHHAQLTLQTQRFQKGPGSRTRPRPSRWKARSSSASCRRP